MRRLLAIIAIGLAPIILLAPPADAAKHGPKPCLVALTQAETINALHTGILTSVGTYFTAIATASTHLLTPGSTLASYLNEQTAATNTLRGQITAARSQIDATKPSYETNAAKCRNGKG